MQKMSIITQAMTMAQDEVQPIDNEIDLIKILSDDPEMNETMNNIQCAGEDISQNYTRNCADISNANSSNTTENKEQEKKIGNDEDDDFSVNHYSDRLTIIESILQICQQFFILTTHVTKHLLQPMISMQGKQPGSMRYIWDGYIYARDGYTHSFRCSNRALYDCPGRAIIKNKEVKETKAHSHPREPYIIEIEKIKQDMIFRARTETSVELRTIYLEACKSEPLVRSHLGLDMMLSKMKKARNGKSTKPSKPLVVKSRKKIPDLNFKWTKDWLEVPYGQHKIAYCKICKKDIIFPTKMRVYNHFLSKIHKQAVLGLYRPPNNTRLQIEKRNAFRRDGRASENGALDPLIISKPDSEQEDTYTIEVLDEFRDEVEKMIVAKKLKCYKIHESESFYEEIIKRQMQSFGKIQARDYNDSGISDVPKPKSTGNIEFSKEINHASMISAHVWDSNTGQPTSGLEISLFEEQGDDWNLVCEILTDRDGKCCDLLYGENLGTGLYKLKLNTRSYYSKLKQRCHFPFIEIVFEVENINELYHFPIQLSQCSYSVCRISKS